MRRMRRMPSTVAAPVAATLVVSALLGACSDDTPAPSPSQSSASGSPTSAGSVTTSAGTSTSTAPAKPVTAAGAPAPLASVIEALYTGGDITKNANATSAAALKGRTRAAAPVTAEVKTGAWKKVPVAVAVVDKDVTLFASDKGAWKIVGGWWPSLNKPAQSLGPAGPRWVLAIGSDARPGERVFNSRADTLQVVGLDGKGAGGVMGIARDLYVPIPGAGKNKINAAMVGGGPAAQLQTVRSVTGLPIEGWFLVDFEHVRQLIDGMGGLYMEIPKAVQSNSISIPAGAYKLRGGQVLAYARERKTLPDGDFGRSRHQGQILMAAALQAKVKGFIGIPEYVTLLSKHIHGSLSAEAMMTFAGRVYAANPMKIGTGVAKGPFGWAGPASIVVLGSEAKALFADFRDGNLP